jgi:uncharacterized OsmC-like protein
MGYHVTVERTESGFIARNGRGGEVVFGTGGEDSAFTPVELLLAAVGGCNIVTVEPLTAQRGHRLERLAATIEAEKIATNRLGTVTMTYDVVLPAGDPAAEEVYRGVAQRVHDKMCTVTTALITETPMELHI